MLRRLWTLAVAGVLLAGLASEASAGVVFGTNASVSSLGSTGNGSLSQQTFTTDMEGAPDGTVYILQNTGNGVGTVTFSIRWDIDPLVHLASSDPLPRHKRGQFLQTVFVRIFPIGSFPYRPSAPDQYSGADCPEYSSFVRTDSR